MLKKHYKLSRDSKVPYVQRGSLNNHQNGFKKFVANQGLWTIFGVIVLGLIIWPLLKNYTKQEALKQEINDFQSQIAAYQDKNTELKELIGYLGSDQAVEEKGRLNLGLKKKDENVMIINQTSTFASLNKADQGESNAGKWWHYFFD